MTKIIFSHGKESGPWGSKIKRLADIAKSFGCDVDSIDYTNTLDPDERVARLAEVLAQQSDDLILVGSSMGGYVSLVASSQTNSKIKGVFLLAPALYIDGYQVQEYSTAPNIEIVHGWSDDVIAPEHSIRYAKTAKCSLHLIDGDHRLNSSLETVEELFSQFLTRSLL
ncbi:alpha/beta hydrolase [Psychrobium sp. MM17-31]|uniref:alpha/beta hydrolase n=1 Tax=Psychrobium sp. MM17-31 TaxID=2917758 RepID=UPI001EF53CB9|nr:YqiA/YcfP family alpha/beta fold hydrolase [Psychrobium sp. MM17-31]MCG7531750.1 alpha/beta hydrolase [Psychrobium sp. MM17-31]